MTLHGIVHQRTCLAAALALLASLTALGACDSKKPAARSTAARSRPPTSLPAPEPDAATVARILEQQGSAGTPTPAPSPIAPAGNASALPPGHPPIGAAPVKAADDAEVAEVALKYDPPASWKKETVNRPMRKAQFTLPRAAGDTEDGQLIVYYFGRGEGGTIELNIERWRNMFTTAEGKPVGDDVVKRAVTEVTGLKTTTLDVTGRYADPMGRPDQSGPTSSEFRMLAAIVETPDGPWFFKAVGPKATMASHAASFEQFIRTVRR